MHNEINLDPDLIVHIINDDGTFPNNARLPLLIYKQVFQFSGKGSPEFIEKTIKNNDWGGSWRNGIYPFHHYHSTAHEVLGVYSGTARVQLGGESGQELVINTGDAVVIPAGVAHKNIQSSHDFRVIGAYPPGQSWDMNYGRKGERPDADQNIAIVPIPDTDPLLGISGPLMVHWK